VEAGTEVTAVFVQSPDLVLHVVLEHCVFSEKIYRFHFQSQKFSHTGKYQMQIEFDTCFFWYLA
jgi:hypothetical protein